MIDFDDSVRVDNSRPPLRWIANWCGSRASAAIMRISWAEEDNHDSGWRYKRDSKIWDYLWPTYEKYGTFYEYKPILFSKWDYEDKETGDAFRIINEDSED